MGGPGVQRLGTFYSTVTPSRTCFSRRVPAVPGAEDGHRGDGLRMAALPDADLRRPVLPVRRVVRVRTPTRSPASTSASVLLHLHGRRGWAARCWTIPGMRTSCGRRTTPMGDDLAQVAGLHREEPGPQLARAAGEGPGRQRPASVQAGGRSRGSAAGPRRRPASVGGSGRWNPDGRAG